MASFVQESVHLSIERRKAQSDFLARGLAAREEANQSGRYVSSAEMLARLDASLARARAGRRADEQ